MRLPRRRLRLTRGKITKMSQERQKLSFFIVIIFLAIFGLIVLAEVLFMDSKRSDDDSSGISFYFDDSLPTPTWETPRPLVLSEQNYNSLSKLGRAPMAKRQRNERFQKSLKLHQDEMERLIKNISDQMQSSVAAVIKLPAPLRPYNYSGEILDEAEQEGAKGGFDGRWQPVNGTMHKFYVYSAFFDPRSGRRIVRVVGATKTKFPDKVWCRFHYAGEDKTALVPASISVIRENWNLRYSAVFVICPLASEPVPPSVSIIVNLPGEDPDGVGIPLPPTNWVKVLNGGVDHKTADARLSNVSDVGVCVKPVHFNYSQTLELVEFIELNKLLGVTHFTLYNDTISPETDCVLRDYVERGTVEVLPWKLNMKSQSEIRTEGLFAALNDCLYRNMYRFNYLMLIDFDEFVMPKNNRTLPEMLRFVDSQKGHVLTGHGAAWHRLGGGSKVTSAYSFQNAFFYLQFPNDNTPTARTVASKGEKKAPNDNRAALPLRTLLKTRRKSKFNPQKQRSKYICIPRRVREAGNHFIWEFVEGYNLNVPTAVGFLHHYRVCEFGGDDCVRTESRVDRTVFKYKSDLVANVWKVLDKLEGQCSLQRITKPQLIHEQSRNDTATP